MWQQPQYSQPFQGVQAEAPSQAQGHSKTGDMVKSYFTAGLGSGKGNGSGGSPGLGGLLGGAAGGAGGAIDGVSGAQAPAGMQAPTSMPTQGPQGGGLLGMAMQSNPTIGAVGSAMDSFNQGYQGGGFSGGFGQMGSDLIGAGQGYWDQISGQFR